MNDTLYTVPEQADPAHTALVMVDLQNDFVHPDGWVAQAFGRSLSAGAAALGSLLMIGGLAWFSRGSPQDSRSRVTDLMVYSFAAAGLIYVANLWLKGSF